MEAQVTGRETAWPRRAVFLALLAASCVPGVSPAAALAGGLAVGVLAGNPWRDLTSRAGKRLLQVSVAGLGFGLGIGQVWQAGRSGIVYTLVGISGTVTAGWLLGRLLRVRPSTAALISFGTAICGGSAIAAVAPLIEAEGEDIAVALATVFSLNAVALLLFPPLGHALGLTQRQFGLWAALAIHDTSSVVGAGAAYGRAALALATTVKLARAAWIVPVTLALAWARRSRGRASFPWFILAFLGAAALRTALPDLGHLWGRLFAGARQSLVVTLFLIGAAIDRGMLRAIGARPLAHGLLLWLAVGTTTLLAIAQGAVR